ncbi:MAG: spore coat protein U domain-containing protein [Caulobacter sp.]
MRLMFIRIAALLLALGIAGAAHAGCIASSPTVTMAQSSSYAVQDNSVPQVSGQAGFSCTGALISLLGGGYARATFNSLNSFQLKTAGGDAIPYKLTVDPGGTVPINQNTQIDYMNVSLLSLLGIGNMNGFNAPIYAKLSGAPNIPAGIYTDTVTVNWNYEVCNGVQIGQLCVLYETGTVTKTVTVTLEVMKDCRISAPNVSFGSVALVSQFAPVSQGVLVNCTKNASYKIGFSNGLSGVSRPWRTMTNGSGQSLQYNLYRPDGVTIWDETNPLTSGVQGTGSTTPSQIQNYTAKINPAQTTPSAGNYSDTVSVVITF